MLKKLINKKDDTSNNLCECDCENCINGDCDNCECEDCPCDNCCCQ